MSTVLANEMMYIPVNSILRGQEKLIGVRHQGSSTFTSDNLQTLRFSLGQVDHWLPRTSYFQFDVTITPSASQQINFTRAVWSLIKSVRVSVGGNQIEHITEYSNLHKMLFELSSEQGAASGVEDSICN